ncbi:hypothetical protein TW65_08419 [Stemphylium lycopersici]|nr:hypothetical protein TW65_08419 [Stemphylium lycopersici]
MAKVISTRDVVFDEEAVFDGKTKNLMDNLMHTTLEEIATWRQQPETETFYEDDTAQEETPPRQQPRYHGGRKVIEAYPTPPPTPPPVAFIVQEEVNNYNKANLSDQATSMTVPWAAAFMAGTEAGHIGQHEGKPIDKAQLKRLMAKGIKPHRNQLPSLPTAHSKLEEHPLYEMFKEKALYGLRISPLLWQKEFTATLAQIGFKQVPQEPCCMIKDGVIIFFYVDDIIIAYHSKQQQEAMKAIELI